MTANAKYYLTPETRNKHYLLSMFVIKHNDALVFPFLIARFKLCFLSLIFCIFHVVHVSFSSNIPTSALVRRLNTSE